MTGEKNINWTKEAIGAELLLWRDSDPAYTLTLVPLALHKGLITEKEAELAKADLDKYYQKIADQAELVKKYKSEKMLKVFQLLGFSPTKLLWRIIEAFPKYYNGEPSECIIRVPHKLLIKELGFSSKDYYTFLTLIEGSGFLTHIEKALWKINFGSIETYEPPVNKSPESEKL